jgi:hypothetical protein
VICVERGRELAGMFLGITEDRLKSPKLKLRVFASKILDD